MKPIILVTGATGAQGGAVAKSLLSDGRFAVRVLTRNPDSEQASALHLAGATVIAGDMDHPRQLRAAMQDCYGVFGVTNFWEHYENEFEQGKHLIDAVHEAGIRHFVFSSLPDYHRISKGMYEVPHCDIKAALQRYAEEKALPATFVQLSFYYENFLSFFPLQLDVFGDFYFGFPQGNTRLGSVSVEDLGPVVLSIFQEPGRYIGQTIPVIGSDLTGDEYAGILSAVLGKRVYYHHIPHDRFAQLNFPGSVELANMFDTQRLYMTGSKTLPLQRAKELNPGIRDFKTWAIANVKQLERTLHREAVFF